jgi:Intracellular proteinase inhibitor
MKTISRLISSITAIAATALAPFAFGQLPPEPEQRPVAAVGGLTLQLTTSAHKVVQPRAVDAAAAANAVPQRDAFAACALLANRSNSPITFTFPDGASAAAKFEFSLRDKEGNEVWRSDEGIGTQVLTEVTLRRGGVWKRLVRVPLVVAGAPLPAGNYTLLAFTDADKQVLAQTLLEVVARPDVPANGKINGAVVKVVAPATGTDPEVIEPVPGAWVTVQQTGSAASPGARLFAWSGRADEAGKFAVEVPAGRYRVTAGENVVVPVPAVAGANIILPPPVYPPQSVEVNVAAGATVDVVIKLTKPVPPAAQGIKGLVVRSLPPEAAAPVSEVPVEGAHVEISEILSNADPALGAPIRAPFHWIGRTNAEGRFEARTPVGKFHVVATKVIFSGPNDPVVQVQVVQPGGANILPPDSVLTASADVAVESGKFSSVKLLLEPSGVPVPVPAVR